VTGTADLAEFRLVRALRGGQPGAFPTLWNAQAGALWSVTRAVCATDAEAVGWATTFRIELAAVSAGFAADEPVAAQVGLALYRHLAPGFAGTAPLPDAPLAATEDALRAIPEAARLAYLVTLFFDVPRAALEPLAGRDVGATIDAVHALLEAGVGRRVDAEGGPEAEARDDEMDARSYVHAALMRAPPVDVLLLPPGAAPIPPEPRWWLLWVAFAAVVVLASVPSLLAWLQRPDLAELADRHRAALADAPLRGTDAAALGLELVRRGVPTLLVDVPELSGAGLTLLGARVIEGGAEPSLVFTYQGGLSLWTLQHLLVEPDLEGAPVATRVTPTGELEAWRAPSAAGDSANDAVFVAWREGGTSWVLSADAPPDDVLYVAARIRQARAILRVPFLGDPASMSPAGATE